MAGNWRACEAHGPFSPIRQVAAYHRPEALAVIGDLEVQQIVAEDVVHVIERPRMPMKAEARFRRKDGSWAHPEAVGSYAPELGGVVVNSWDITERKRVEDEIRALNADLERRAADRTRELAQANERLQELGRLKSKFVSDVSHELLTPITNMICT